jgi:hypothetical protein
LILRSVLDHRVRVATRGAVLRRSRQATPLILPNRAG